MNRVAFLRWSLVLFLGYGLSSKSVISQDSTNVGAPSSQHSNSERETSPLKYETGDVTINLRLASERLKKQSESQLNGISSTLMNRDKSNEVSKIQDTISQGNTAYLRGDYTNSRRLFKACLIDIEKMSSDINKSYRELFQEYTGSLTGEISKLRLDRSKVDGNPNLLPHLERKGQEAGELYRQGEFLSMSKQNYLAMNYYQLSIRALLEGIVRSRQEWEKKPKPDDHLEEKDKKIFNEVRGILNVSSIQE